MTLRFPTQQWIRWFIVLSSAFAFIGIYLVTSRHTSLYSEPSDFDLIVAHQYARCSSNSSNNDTQNTLPKHEQTHNSSQRGLCRHFSQGYTASALWRRHLNEILEASLHPLDSAAKEHEEWTERLLRLMTPHLLQRGLRTHPSRIDVQRVLNVIQERLQNSTAPPLQVAVLGGSVTEGVRCERLPFELDKGRQASDKKIVGQVCAWPYRLQRLADHFFGPNVIRIYNLGVGGTSSKLASPILKYWLYPKSAKVLQQGGPDVIINAYAVNDNLFSWDSSSNATADNTHFENTLAVAQEFLRTARQSRPCTQPPVVVFLNDYFGNLNELILAEDIRHEAVQLLSDYYETMYVSYTHTVRPFVFANSDETLFSPDWWNRKHNKTIGRMEYTRRHNGHFGMPGHVIVSWVMAFSFLQTIVDYCEDERILQSRPQKSKSALVSEVLVKPLSNALPPLLDRNLTLSSIPTKRLNDAERQRQSIADYCQSKAANQSPCPFAFLATPSGTARGAGMLNKYIRKFALFNSGWNGENDYRNGWQNKLGLVAHQPGSSIVLVLKNIESRVRFVALQALKSYGELWANSKAQFDLSVRDGTKLEYQTSFNITGYHQSNTSIAYPFLLDLGDHAAQIGRTVELNITLVMGSTFKIIALMMCSR